MELELHSSWVEEFKIRRLHGLDSNKQIRVLSPERVELETGYEYLLTGVDRNRTVLLDPLLIGPAEAGSRCRPSLFHRSIIKTSLLVRAGRGKPPRSMRFMPDAGPLFGEGLLPPAKLLREEEGGALFELPFVEHLGGRLCFETEAGPAYIEAPASLPSKEIGMLALALPELAALEVKTKEGAPIENAEIYLQRGKGWPDFGTRARWFYGWTDSGGRIALPASGYKGGRILILAWGCRPKSQNLASSRGKAILEPDEIRKIEIPFSETGRRIFTNFLRAPGRPSSHPRFVEGTFQVPETLLQAARAYKNESVFRSLSLEKRLLYSDLKIRSGLYLTKLDYWSPDGFMFDLCRPGEITPHRRMISGLPGGEGAYYSLCGFDGSGSNRLFTPSVPHPLAASLPIAPDPHGRLAVPIPLLKDMMSFNFFGPAYPPVTWEGEVGKSTPPRGSPAELIVQEPPAGTWLEFRVVGGEGINKGGGKEGWHLARTGGAALLDEKGRFRLGLPKGSRLVFLLHRPGAAPFCGRLDPGETLTAPPPAKAAWGLLTSSHGTMAGIPTRLRFKKAAKGEQSDPAAFNAFGYKTWVSRWQGRRPPACLLGPLPPGTYGLRRRRNDSPRILELVAGRIEEFEL